MLCSNSKFSQKHTHLHRAKWRTTCFAHLDNWYNFYSQTLVSGFELQVIILANVCKNYYSKPMKFIIITTLS